MFSSQHKALFHCMAEYYNILQRKQAGSISHSPHKYWFLVEEAKVETSKGLSLYISMSFKE